MSQNEKQTLLEIAKSKPRKYHTNSKVDQEKIELVVAYLNDEISLGQVRDTLGISTGSVQNLLSSTLLLAVRAGLITISMNGK